MTGQSLFRLIAERYKAEPDDLVLSIGHYAKPYPERSLGMFNLPEFCAAVALSVGDIRELAAGREFGEPDAGTAKHDLMANDAARLDWLIENTAWPMEDPGQGWFVAFYESEPQHGFHATARAAIDAAMREGK